MDTHASVRSLMRTFVIVTLEQARRHLPSTVERRLYAPFENTAKSIAEDIIRTTDQSDRAITIGHWQDGSFCCHNASSMR